jgi:hypothetical protein
MQTVCPFGETNILKLKSDLDSLLECRLIFDFSVTRLKIFA